MLAGTAVADEQDRAFGIGDQRERLGNGLLVGHRSSHRLAGRDGRVVDFLLGDVLGQLDQGRSRPLRGGHLERLADDLGDVVLVADGRRPLGDGLEHRDDVHGLVGLLVQASRRSLPRDGDDGRGVHVGGGHPRDQVGGSGPQRG